MNHTEIHGILRRNFLIQAPMDNEKLKIVETWPTSHNRICSTVSVSYRDEKETAYYNFKTAAVF